MSAFETSSALGLIRTSTASIHRRLEQSLEIARTDADEGAYVRYLEALFGWLEPLEARLWADAWRAPIPVALRDAKTAWIAADLRARGRRPSEIGALPRQRALPPLASLPQRLGAAYVVEGAQLGGRALLRRLGARLALPTRWLRGYGADGAAHWRAFTVALDACLHDSADARLAAESARITFELAHAWFAQRGIA